MGESLNSKQMRKKNFDQEMHEENIWEEMHK